ncbi:uncharacterized protein [Pocillopora verrucosa]|uniref:uncharacterized protein n=1 Tax=Pocillopora verrucosa TaxID=203993 RepID=UPI003340A1A4
MSCFGRRQNGNRVGNAESEVCNVIHKDTTYQLWSWFSQEGDGIMKRNPNGGKVSCDGRDQNSDHQNTYATTRDKTQGTNDPPCYAFLFDKKYAMKGSGKGQSITTVGTNSSDYKGKSVVFEPQYCGAFTMLKLYDTDLYVGCDRKGVTTLMESVDHTNPSPKILFLAEKVISKDN